MAALDTPWITSMADSSPRRSEETSASRSDDANPSTYAAFSPSSSQIHSQQRSTILVHQKSPLLTATPPQITRALAYSHPFLLPLNKALGILTWTTGDPWESFLLCAGFWAIALYGDFVIRWAGPLVLVTGLVVGMYSRRYSPLSSTGWTGEKQKGHKRGDSEFTNTRHHKSLEEIVDTVKEVTSRCNILMDPFLRLTDFLSIQRTATSATTRPALTTLFLRILLVTPIWVLMALPPVGIITTNRVVLVIGTIILSWHSRPARISRIILWRSKTIRHICALITGLHFPSIDSKKDAEEKGPPLPPRTRSANDIAASIAAKRRPESPGIRFTFTVYENQRRWLGIGWTSSMLAYERASWTDESLLRASSTDEFELPEVEGGHARWRWVKDSRWRVDGAQYTEADPSGAESDKGWIYYNSKWQDARRGQDGWGRYTRRRKWYRDAELVEVTPSTDITPSETPRARTPSRDVPRRKPVPVSVAASESETTLIENAPDSPVTDTETSEKRKRRWFRRASNTASVNSTTTGNTGLTNTSTGSRRSDEDDILTPLRYKDDGWNLGDDAQSYMG